MIKFRLNNFHTVSTNIGGLYKENRIFKFKKIALYKATFKISEHTITFYIISIEIGRDYAYFEEFPNAIACVKAVEDNSDDETIKFKFRIEKGIHPSMMGKEGSFFEASAARGLFSYTGMWKIKNFNMINIASAMSAPKGDVIEMEHVKAVCKIGAGEGKCCRYLIMGSGGFECARHTELSAAIDERADSGQMNAKGKNCEGYGKSKNDKTEGSIKTDTASK